MGDSLLLDASLLICKIDEAIGLGVHAPSFLFQESLVLILTTALLGGRDGTISPIS